MTLLSPLEDQTIPIWQIQTKPNYLNIFSIFSFKVYFDEKDGENS